MLLPSVLILLAIIPLISGDCSPDNLIRGLERHGGLPYCILLLTPDASMTMALPSEVATSSHEAAAISSACSCLLQHLTDTASASRTYSLSEPESTLIQSSRTSLASATTRPRPSSRVCKSHSIHPLTTGQAATTTTTGFQDSLSKASQTFSASSIESRSSSSRQNAARPGRETLSYSGDGPGSLVVSSTDGVAPSFPSSYISSSSVTPSQRLSNSSATSTSLTHTLAPTTRGFDSYFSGIEVTGDLDATSCYTLPTDVSELKESPLNQNRSAPYIDSIIFNEAGTDVKYIRVVDASDNSFIIDMTSSERFALSSSDGLTISMDSQGVHFANKDCSIKSSILVEDFFQQISKLSNSTCSRGNTPLNQTATMAGGDTSLLAAHRLFSLKNFFVILYLKNQCGEELREGILLDVRVGSSQCATYPGIPGAFVASCGLPSEAPGQMRCEASVQLAIDYLTRGSLKGLCPSFPTLWTMLLNELEGVVSKSILFQPFLNAGLNISPWKTVTLSRTLDSFLGFWRRAADHFGTNTQGSTTMQDLLAGMDTTRDIKRRACLQLHASSRLQNLTVSSKMATGGEIYPPSPAQILDSLGVAPNRTLEYRVTVTDPEQRACCQKPSSCVRDDRGVYYSRDARVPGSDCICGRTMGSTDGVPLGVAFRSKVCRDYPGCNATSPCALGSVCLLDSCCGFNICVNGTECHSAPSAPGDRQRVAKLGGAGKDGQGDSETSGGVPFW